MDITLLMGGIAVIVLVTVDQQWSILGDGAGPVSARANRGIWIIVRWVARRLPESAGRRLLRAVGPTVYISTVLLWMLLNWLGWSLIWSSDAEALQVTASGETVDLGDRMAFVGYVMVTLTRGDYAAQGGWRLVTSVMTGQEFFTLTLVISYLLNIVTALVDKRSTALRIASVGCNPSEFLLHFWHRDRFDGLADFCSDLTPSITRLSEQYLLYPALHYFHSSRRGRAIAPMLALLDEALTLRIDCIEEIPGQHLSALLALREANTAFLRTLGSAFIEARHGPPPPPDLSLCEEAGVPLRDGRAIAEGLAALGERRALLLALVRDDSWDWSDVVRPGADDAEDCHLTGRRGGC